MATFEHYKLVIPAGFYHVTFEYEIGGVPEVVMNTWGFGGAGYVPVAADVDALADAWNTEVIQVLASTNTAFTRTTWTDASGLVFDEARADSGLIASAGIASVGLAANAQKRTGVGGRQHRGRCLLPWIPEAKIDESGKLALDYRSDVNDALEAFRVAANAIDVNADIVLLHSKGWDGGTEPPDPGNAPAPDIITGFATQVLAGFIKRRVR